MKDGTFYGTWFKANDSFLTLTEIEAGGKEYLRSDGYDKMDVTDCDTQLKENTI